MAERTCLDCPTAVSSRNRLGRCKACTLKTMWTLRKERAPKPPRVCLDCPTEIKSSKSGRCHRCAVKLRFADPEVRKKISDGKKRSFAESPEKRRRVSEAGAINLARWKQENPETFRALGQLSAERRMEWCPVDQRAFNHSLKRQGFKLEERKRIIRENVPGTIEHARRVIANNNDAMRIKHERDLASRY